MGNALSKMVCDFWLYHITVTFGGFKVFKTYLRSMTKSDDSIKPSSLLHSIKVCAILKAYLYYYCYILNMTLSKVTCIMGVYMSTMRNVHTFNDNREFNM